MGPPRKPPRTAGALPDRTSYCPAMLVFGGRADSRLVDFIYLAGGLSLLCFSTRTSLWMRSASLAPRGSASLRG